MPSLIALIAAQAVPSPPVAPVYSPPPPIMSVNSPPPAVVVEPGPGRPRLYAIPEANDAPPDVLAVRILSGPEVLWEGEIRVGRPGASMIQHLNQTEPAGCPPSPYANSVHSGLSISLRRDMLSITPPGAFTYQLRVAWERPSSVRGCGGEGARKVEISRGMDLRRGQVETLEGDVGLSVVIRRR